MEDGMKTRKIRVAKRDFSLLFSYGALADLCEEIEGFDLGKILEYVKTPKFLPTLITVLARAGEAAEGRKLDVDAAWFAAHMRPSPVSLMKIQVAVNEALADGMLMETEEEEATEVDVVLEELKKKETPGASRFASLPPTDSSQA